MVWKTLSAIVMCCCWSRCMSSMFACECVFLYVREITRRIQLPTTQRASEPASYVDDANDRAIYYISLRFSLLVPLRWIYSRKCYGAHKRFLRYTHTFTHAQTNTEHTVSKSKQRTQHTYTLICFSLILFRWFLFIIGFFILFRFSCECSFHSELCFCAIWITHFTHTKRRKRKKEISTCTHACQPVLFHSCSSEQHSRNTLLIVSMVVVELAGNFRYICRKISTAFNGHAHFISTLQIS